MPEHTQQGKPFSEPDDPPGGATLGSTAEDTTASSSDTAAGAPAAAQAVTAAAQAITVAAEAITTAAQALTAATLALRATAQPENPAQPEKAAAAQPEKAPQPEKAAAAQPEKAPQRVTAAAQPARAERPPQAGSAGPAGPTSTEIDPALRRLILTVTLGAIMAILDTTIVAVAIDTLGRDFGSSLSTISWVTTGYLLALAVVIPLTGWAVERFGATRMWSISLILFLAGSALCGAAWSAESLVVFRVLQGLGGGMILPICMTVLARAAGPQRMNRIMNVFGIPTLVAPVLGPVIGGLIVDNLDWRWIFFVNLPIGAVALIAAWRVLPRDDRGQAHRRLDVPGLLLISPGLAALVYGLSQAGSDGGFGSVEVQVSVAVGVVALVGFVVHALRQADALLDLRLFRDRTFSFASATTFMIGATLFGAMFLLPLYYQLARGQSALVAGLSLAPQGLGAMAAMPVVSRVADRRGAGFIVPIGMAVSLLGSLAFTQIDAHTSEAALAACLFVRGFGFGASMMPAMGSAFMKLEPAAVPRATTTINIVQRVGGSLATALVAVELQHAISTRIPGAGDSGLDASRQTDLSPAIADQIGSAFGVTFWWVVALTAAGLVAALFLPRHPAAPRAAAAPRGQDAPPARDMTLTRDVPSAPGTPLDEKAVAAQEPEPVQAPEAVQEPEPVQEDPIPEPDLPSAQEVPPAEDPVDPTDDPTTDPTDDPTGDDNRAGRAAGTGQAVPVAVASSPTS